MDPMGVLRLNTAAARWGLLWLRRLRRQEPHYGLELLTHPL